MNVSTKRNILVSILLNSDDCIENLYEQTIANICPKTIGMLQIGCTEGFEGDCNDCWLQAYKNELREV